MAHTKWYSPQLSRDLVSRLYHLAKSERVPMTRLANELLNEAMIRRESQNVELRAAEKSHSSPG